MDSYVTQLDQLDELISALRRQPLVAVDTEAASFHRYRDRICLVQLSSATHAAIVDPLALEDLTPLGELLADRGVEKVFHDADYDLRTLDRDYGFHGAALFDTRIAAQLAGEAAVGLAALLQKYLDVTLTKEHQRADWSQRPLPEDMLAYAAADTRHLPALRERLRERLTEMGRLAWAEEEFGHLEELRWTGNADGADAYLRLKGARTLTGRQLAALRELYRWREELAARQDRATFRIVDNEVLLAVSRALPTTPAALAETTGVPPAHVRRHGVELVTAVRRAMTLAEGELPRLERVRRPPRDPAFDARVERLKAARNRMAGELGLDPGVLCGRPTLEAVARAVPNDRAGLAQLGELRRWQIEVLGDALLAALG